MSLQPAALLAAIVESSDDAIVTKDLTGRIMTWNAGAERLFGYSAAEAIGRHVTFIIPAERLAEETYVMSRVLEGVGVHHFETVRVRKDGSFVDVSLAVSPVRDQSGRIMGASKIARDITAQKMGAARLADEIRIVETLDRIAAAITSTLDRDHVMQAVLEAAADVTGALWGAFVFQAPGGQTGDAVIHVLRGTPRDIFDRAPDPVGRVDAGLIERVDPSTQDDAVRPARVVRIDDAAAAAGMVATPHLRSYLSVATVSRSDQQFGRLFLGHPKPGVFTERHERLVVGISRWGALALENAQLYQDARQINQQKDEFLATLSHELRTPLNAIMGWAQILGSDAFDDRSRERAVATIQRNARAQARLIDDLLDVSRIVSGKFVLRREEVDLKTIIAMALDDVRPTASERGIELRAVIEDEGMVSGDIARLQQIVWNLLSNAVKFTPPPGRVTVSLTRSGDTARIAVSDTGQGIEADFLGHVFDRFRQADASATRRHGGLGLGLGIVKHLVEAHGGTVQAHSGGPGQGATFIVELPACVEVSAATRRRETGEAMAGVPRLAGMRVLAVDDERDAADMLAVALRHAGADVVTAYEAREALQYAQSDGFDVVLADIGMPGMDGCVLIHALRGSSQRRRFLGVAVTAYASPADRARALEAGFDLHLAKPIPPADVVSAIARALAS